MIIFNSSVSGSPFSSVLSSSALLKKIKSRPVPLHIAIIMDGNGRWATKKRLPRIFGHQKGAEVLREVVIASRDAGIKYLTAFSFSSENWDRPPKEVKQLLKLFVEVLARELPGLMENDVRLNLIGKRDIIPPEILKIFTDAEKKTSGNKTLVFNIAFSYGSRQEITDGINSLIASRAKKGETGKNGTPEKITIDDFSSFLYTWDLPDPDLLIRTSGEYRLSNFLLWQIAYTELYFTKTLWPDFGRKNYFRAILDFQQRSRRFGKV